ncbi:MAG: histidinol-phosphatase HisJ family protein [bacterium]
MNTTLHAALPPDYHMHTTLCKHAKGTTQEFKKVARERGLPELCFTDHCPEPSGYDSKHRMSIDEVPAYYDLVKSQQDGTQPDIFIGIEGDYFPGCETFLSEFLPRQPLDLVLGSVHYIKDWGFDNPDYLKMWESVDVKGVWKEYFSLIKGLVDTHLFDMIGHFDLPKKFGHRLRDKDMKELVQPVLDHIAKSGMGMEINTSGWRRKAEEAYPSPLILSLACERGIPITFGSDAHAPNEVGHEFEKALRLAKEAGYKDSLRFRTRQGTRVPLP